MSPALGIASWVIFSFAYCDRHCHVNRAVTLADYVRKKRESSLYVSCCRRIPGDFGEFTPRREACGKVFAIKGGAQQMPLQGETLADWSEAREESLSGLRVAKSSHASLAFAGWLMTVLGAVVHAGSGISACAAG